MEITTKEIQQRLCNGSKDKLLSLASQMRAAGVNDDGVREAVSKYIDLKVDEFYNQKRELTPLKDILIQCLSMPDSTAEAVFFQMLRDNGIPFQFQYKIGPYVADYLIGDRLVVELDGPVHRKANQKRHDETRDAYMVRLGYHVLRLNLEIIALDIQAAIDGIKELAEVSRV